MSNAMNTAAQSASPADAPVASPAKSRLVTFLLIAAVVVLAVFPMFFNFSDPNATESFGGTDGAAGDIVLENNPDYTPWFEPLVGELPGEVESGLFALQAALGAGVLFYVIGYYRGRGKGRKEVEFEQLAEPSTP